MAMAAYQSLDLIYLVDIQTIHIQASTHKRLRRSIVHQCISLVTEPVQKNLILLVQIMKVMLDSTMNTWPYPVQATFL